MANRKTVTIEGGKDNAVVLATTKTKKQNKPGSLLHKSVMKKEFRDMAKAISNQVLKPSNFIILVLISYDYHMALGFNGGIWLFWSEHLDMSRSRKMETAIGSSQWSMLVSPPPSLSPMSDSNGERSST